MSTHRLDLYKEAIRLESERTRLLEQVSKLDDQLDAIKSSLFRGESASAPVKATKAAPIQRGKKGRARRGELTESILQALQSAGAKGIKVPDLAAALGVKATNVHAWFQASGKKYPQITKISRGVYGVKGSIGATPPPKETGASTKGTKKRKRGGLAAKITDALTTAGQEGIKLKDLATKLGVKYGNLSVWFATTGKKNKAIQKIGEAHYRIA